MGDQKPGFSKKPGFSPRSGRPEARLLQEAGLLSPRPEARLLQEAGLLSPRPEARLLQEAGLLPTPHALRGHLYGLFANEKARRWVLSFAKEPARRV